MHLRGEVIHGEFNSADARVAAAVKLYDGDGKSRELAPNERLIITDLVIVAVTKMALNIFSDNDGNGAAGDGERIFTGSIGDSGAVIAASLATPRYCRRGVTPKIKTDSAGQVDVLLTGFVLKH